MHEVTIITSLFNIDREKMDGRSWNEYLHWFDKTLKIKCPMMIFISKDLISFVEERRTTIPTEIIVQTKEEVPYYFLKKRIDDIISSEVYKHKILDSSRIECQHSMYSIIQYSKFKWLKQTIEENPFNSKFFFWLDAGASRFFEDVDLNNNYPSFNAIDALNKMGNKFLIQKNMEYYSDLVNADILTEEYLIDNRSYVLGSMFGGTSESILRVDKEIENIFLNDMIENNFVNNEQIALGYLIKKFPELFEYYERYDGKHLSLFMELSKQ
jgi:hypothetical protein